MSIPRFRIQASARKGATVQLDDAREVHHAQHVLRLRVGARCIAFDGQGTTYHGRIMRMTRRAITLHVDRTEQAQAPLSELILVQALPKLPAFEAVLRHATELGVTRIMPVLTERSVVKAPQGGWSARMRRWSTLVSEASKQCGRADMPEIIAPTRWAACVEQQLTSGLRLIPTLGVAGPLLADVLATQPALTAATVCIGPEGDFTPAEVEALVARGGLAVSLGPRSLRVETAALSSLAIIGTVLNNSCHQ